jgi:hypothetical protein
MKCDERGMKTLLILILKLFLVAAQTVLMLKGALAG